MLAYLIIKQAKFQYFFPFVTPYYKCYITQNPSQLGITIDFSLHSLIGILCLMSSLAGFLMVNCKIF